MSPLFPLLLQLLGCRRGLRFISTVRMVCSVHAPARRQLARLRLPLHWLPRSWFPQLALTPLEVVVALLLLQTVTGMKAVRRFCSTLSLKRAISTISRTFRTNLAFS
jgi:hypothetical protein